MAQHLLLCGIFLTCVFMSVEAQAGLLMCRICRGAKYLEDCNEAQFCSHNEECYIEEIITDQLQVVFNAGCRSTQLCRLQHKRAEHEGLITCTDSCNTPNKRDQLIACTHCCNEPKMANTTECNSNLCGLTARRNDSNSNMCYYCGNYFGARQGAVSDPRTCLSIKFCPDDQVCSVTTKNTGGVITYEFGCKPLLECQIRTIANLELQGVHTGIDIVQLAGTGTLQIIGRKRQTNICDICCGDDLCNDDSCESVRRRLVTFGKANKFNYTSLKFIQ